MSSHRANDGLPCEGLQVHDDDQSLLADVKERSKIRAAHHYTDRSFQQLGKTSDTGSVAKERPEQQKSQPKALQQDLPEVLIVNEPQTAPQQPAQLNRHMNTPSKTFKLLVEHAKCRSRSEPQTGDCATSVDHEKKNIHHVPDLALEVKQLLGLSTAPIIDTTDTISPLKHDEVKGKSPRW